MIHIVDNINRFLHLQELGHYLIRNKYIRMLEKQPHEK